MDNIASLIKINDNCVPSKIISDKETKEFTNSAYIVQNLKIFTSFE
jgi:hypothetical protein